MAAGQGVDLCADCGVGDLVVAGQREGMDADGVRDHEFHPCQAHAIDRKPPPAGGGGGVGDVEHDLGPGRGHGVEAGIGHLKGADAGIDEAVVALGAADGDLLPVVQEMGGVPGADHGRQAEFAADDGGVAGAAAMVGDDRAGAFHHRHPVGIGGRGDEDRTVDEAADVGGGLDQADLAGGHGLADAEAAEKERTLGGEAPGADGADIGAALHRLGPGLDDVDPAGDAVAGPFHVHRLAVVPFDGDGHAREVEDFAVGEDEAFAFGA